MPPSKPEKEEEESIGKGEEGTKVHDAPLPPRVTTKKKGVELRRVDHTYRDYSDYPPSAVAKKACGKLINFPAKLHEILSTPDFECVSRFFMVFSVTGDLILYTWCLTHYNFSHTVYIFYLDR